MKNILSNFSCEKNEEIEVFLKKNSIDFAKRNMSITHLVFDEKMTLVAYFTLTHKSLNIKKEVLSKTSERKLQMHAKYDSLIEAYSTSAFLIAQFGKNDGEAISGLELMKLVWVVLWKVQHLVGGGVVFLECEDNPKLLAFYQNEENRFKIFGERRSDDEKILYKQLLRFF